MRATRRDYICRGLIGPCVVWNDAKESAAFAEEAEAVGEDRNRGDLGASVRVRGREDGTVGGIVGVR